MNMCTSNCQWWHWSNAMAVCVLYDLFSWLITGLRRNHGSQHRLTTEVLAKGCGLCTVHMCILGIFIPIFHHSEFQYPMRSNTIVVLSVFKGGFPSNSRMCLHVLYTYALHRLSVRLNEVNTQREVWVWSKECACAGLSRYGYSTVRN